MDLTIIGGGITGLAAAYLASRSGRRVRVLEAGREFGGLLGTFQVGGTRLEYYYHHFFTHDAEILWLLRELRLEDHLRFLPTTMGVFRDGRAFPFNGPRDLFMFTPLSWMDKFRFAASSYYLGRVASPLSGENIPARTWLRRWAGAGPASALWDPMLNIKFGPFADEVPLRWMIGRLRQRMASRTSPAQERLGYLDGSLWRLLDRLLHELKSNGVELIANAPVRELVSRDGSLVAVRTPVGDFSGTAFLATIPTLHLGPLLQPVLPAYAREIGRIRYFGAVCVVLEMDRPLSPVYWLNVADTGFPFGGVIEQTKLIGPENYNGIHIAYLSRYFSAEEEIANLGREELGELMVSHLPRLSSTFKREHISKIHVFRTNTAATVCGLNFSETVPNCQSPLKGLYLANMAHIYPDERSVNNSIRVAAEAVRVIGYSGPQVPSNRSLSAQIGFGHR